MTEYQNPSDYGVLTEPATLKIQRLLPGPVERVWSYLTDSELRSQWLAAGEMAMEANTPFEFVWRNDELTNPPGQRPAKASREHRMEGRITDLEMHRKLAITWGETGGVSFELEPMGNQVMLTITHHRVPDQATLLSVSSGWHAHLDILVARLEGSDPEPFWDNVAKLKEEYGQRLSA